MLTAVNVNEIKDLRRRIATSREFSDKQADVIRNYLNQIATLEKVAKDYGLIND